MDPKRSLPVEHDQHQHNGNKTPRLSHPGDEQVVELLRQANAIKLSSSSPELGPESGPSSTHRLPLPLSMMEANVPRSFNNQAVASFAVVIEAGPPYPVTLHDRSTANYPTSLPSLTLAHQSSSTNDAGLPSPITEPSQSSSSTHSDVGMTGQSSTPGGTFDGTHESASALSGASSTTEVPANTAAHVTRGAGSKQHTLPRDAATGSASSNAGGKHVHQATGYEWERDEDAPGWIWKNRKAREEHSRAMEQIIEKDRMIGNRYGDFLLDQDEEQR